MHDRNSKISLLLILCLGAWGALSAQKRDDTGRGGGSTTGAAPEIEEQVIDTVQLRYFTLRDRNNYRLFSDTLLQDFEKYQKNRQFDYAALNLGNFGSANYMIRYKERRHIFTDAGFHQYDNYKLDPLDHRYFVLGQAYNDLYFSPVAGQQNFLVKAKFARNFAGRTQISLDYERVLQEGFYNNQRAKQTQFVVGLWKQSQSGRHEYFISFAANNHNEEINGGITPGENFEGSFSRLRTTIETQLEEDTTRHQNFNYSLDNFFNLQQGKYRFHHGINIGAGYYRFGDHDVSSANDSLTYLSYLTESRGIRYYLGYNNVKNDFDLSFNTKNIGLKLGLSHFYQSFDDNVTTRRINDLVLQAQLDFKIKKYTDFRGIAAFGIGKNAGNLNLDGQFAFHPFPKIDISGKIQILRYDAFVNQRSAYVTGIKVFENDFSKINAFKVGGTIHLKGLGIDAGFLSGIIDKAIYYTSEALPAQLDGSTEYIQIELKHKLKWKFIGIENSILYQKFSDNIYHLPKVYSIHNAYIEMRLFKRHLLAQIGMLYYNIRYDGALKFMPVTGSFYPSEEEIEYFPYSEFYANFKIKQFRLFIKIDNFTDMITRKEHFQIVGYPQIDYKTRIGVRWIIRG